MVKISIIIPAYNEEKYIQRCLDSVITNKEYNKLIEIIIINDCSTDNTDNIIKNYIKNHNNINFKYIINEENLGLGKSRNKALTYAEGEYVHFIDSDDKINADVFYEMYKLLETNGDDYCICKNKRFDKDGNTYYKPVDYVKYEDLTYSFSVGCELLPTCYPNLLINAVCWIYLIRIDLIKKNNITFGEGKYEDIPFTYNLHHYGDRFSFVNKVGYYYFNNNEGICNSSTVEDINYLIFNQIVPLLEDEKFELDYKNEIALSMFRLLPHDFIKFNVNLKYFRDVYFRLNKFMNEYIFDRLIDIDSMYRDFYLSVINNDEEAFDFFKLFIGDHF